MSSRTLAAVLALAIGLTVLFWGPLWRGHGLIGGDLYSYFFPQKVYYAESLSQGRFPLWNHLVGFGYPALAESQTGVFYPPNPLLYRTFDVNTAYNVSQLGHYVAAFILTFLLMRRLALSNAAAALGSIVFVYGWFPPRICLEWAIIGGVHFALTLWGVESFLSTGRKRWMLLIAASQGTHLLAGHFNLAFITQLTSIVYAGLRILQHRENRADGSRKPHGEVRRGRAWWPLVGVLLSLLFGFLLAAVQILPTWELKQLSQREDVGAAHDPGYGHIPPWYLSQIAAPWFWYPEDVDPDRALNSIRALTIPSSTNKVEAHLYFGLVPLLLAGYRLWCALRGAALEQRHRLWLWLGLAAVVYATGWLTPVSRHLPGFSFFMGPGRYGIVATMAAGLLAGAGLDHLLAQRPPFRSLLVGLVIGLSLVDLYWVSRRVTYAVMIPDPPIDHLAESEIRRELRKYEARHGAARSVRMLAPGPNFATLIGFAAYPQYLGIGPAAYFDPKHIMPEPVESMSAAERRKESDAQQEWLREGAFTHLLTMQPVDPADWPAARLTWKGADRVLNRVYAHRGEFYLYELPAALNRIRAAEATDLEVRQAGSESAVLSVATAKRTEITWADLAYPGWTAIATTNSGTTRLSTDTGLFRQINVPAGETRLLWKFDPRSYRIGRLISLTTLAVIVTLCGIGLWRRKKRIGAGSRS